MNINTVVLLGKLASITAKPGNVLDLVFALDGPVKTMAHAQIRLPIESTDSPQTQASRKAVWAALTAPAPAGWTAGDTVQVVGTVQYDPKTQHSVVVANQTPGGYTLVKRAAAAVAVPTPANAAAKPAAPAAAPASGSAAAVRTAAAASADIDDDIPF